LQLKEMIKVNKLNETAFLSRDQQCKFQASIVHSQHTECISRKKNIHMHSTHSLHNYESKRREYTQLNKIQM